MNLGTSGVPSDPAGGNTGTDRLTGRNGGDPTTPRAASSSGAMTEPAVACRVDPDAVVFSIQFYGKTIGEVGLMDQDLSELDWKKFKSYIFQNLLSMNHQENICVSYSDDEGDKLPIDSEEEYREALKIAKKKAEVHDKLVLDITRQGSLPTVLSFVSSGIKRVSSSPPKEGISFFKASSLPKESSGFMGRAAGTERKIHPTFFSTDKGPVPGHVLGLRQCGRGLVVRCGDQASARLPPYPTFTNTPPVSSLSNHTLKYDASPCNARNEPLDLSRKHDFFGAGEGEVASRGARPKVSQQEARGGQQPPQWFTTYMTKFREDVCEEITSKLLQAMREGRLIPPAPAENKEVLEEKLSQLSVEATASAPPLLPSCGSLQTNPDPVEANLEASFPDQKANKGKMADMENIFCDSNPQNSDKYMKTLPKEDATDVNLETRLQQFFGEEEKSHKKLEKIQERIYRRQEKVEERFSRKKEKLEERFIKKQEKIAERLQKQQEKIDKKKQQTKHPEEAEKTSRSQEKVLAKMEGLRKKQACSPEELNKLRKVVDKHHRAAAADQRQLRRNERRTGKTKKINIDNKAFPVDASLLHTALQELEALAEDSPSEGHSATTRGYDARYVKDITYPDGSEVVPGTEFIKTWRVMNSGMMAWNEKTVLCKWTQVRFQGSPVGWKLKPSQKKVVCPPLKPGQEGEISITFTAPSEPGWYATHWRFCQRGRVFGNQMWCAVHVSDTSASEGTQAVSQESCEEGRLEPPNTAAHSITPPGTLQELVAAAEDRPLLEEVSVCVAADLTTDSNCQPTENPDSHSQEVLPSTNYEVGIIENYYDAEDPTQEATQQEVDATQDMMKCLSLAAQDGSLEPRDAPRLDMDLISFEEDAELLPSRCISPDPTQSPSHTHSVIPLKDMAKESVDSLRDTMPWKDGSSGSKTHSVPSESQFADELSISSGSFSELDSEDQAILNESDSDLSDQDYYVVNMPECFDLTSPYSGVVKVSPPHVHQPAANSVPEAERHDSPDFLTADEDDRATTVVYQSSTGNRADSLTGDCDDSVSSEGNNACSLTETVHEAPQTSGHANKASQPSQDPETAANGIPVLPLPPTETKGFMDIPPEALRTNVAYYFNKELVASEVGKPQEEGRATWGSETEDKQEVVCEQPVSAQVTQSQAKATSATRLGREGKGQQLTSAGQPSGQHNPPTTDLATALPDELVSIIPEDLVRGVWNTARTFITRINQEMLSPSGSSPERAAESGEQPVSQPPSSPTLEPPQLESGRQEAVNTPPQEQVEDPVLPPPLQQLADMGFSNHEVNQRLLTKYNNDVACAVAELIVLNCQ